MDAIKRELYKAKLNEHLTVLLGTLGKARTEYSEAAETAPDLTDQASLDWERNFDMKLRDRERRMLTKIREALLRIEDGTYGICESCDEEISEKRLLARPVSTLCVECKSEAEQREKQRVEDDE